MNGPKKKHVTVLTRQDISKRYCGEMANTPMATLVEEAVKNHFEIALIEDTRFRNGDGDLFYHSKAKLDKELHGTVKICGFVDMSEIEDNRLYVSFVRLNQAPLDILSKIAILQSNEKSPV